jgi:hypothetical protein
MINLIIWFAAFLCPNPNHTTGNHGSCNMIHVTTVSNSAQDTGGETGGTPKPPVPPPPPPTGN